MIVVFADLTGTKGWHTFLDIAAGIDGLRPRTVAGRCVAGTAAAVAASTPASRQRCRLNGG